MTTDEARLFLVSFLVTMVSSLLIPFLECFTSMLLLLEQAVLIIGSNWVIYNEALCQTSNWSCNNESLSYIIHKDCLCFHYHKNTVHALHGLSILLFFILKKHYHMFRCIIIFLLYRDLLSSRSALN